MADGWKRDSVVGHIQSSHHTNRSTWSSDCHRLGAGTPRFDWSASLTVNKGEGCPHVVGCGINPTKWCRDFRYLFSCRCMWKCLFLILFLMISHDWYTTFTPISDFLLTVWTAQIRPRSGRSCRISSDFYGIEMRQFQQDPYCKRSMLRVASRPLLHMRDALGPSTVHTEVR